MSNAPKSAVRTSSPFTPGANEITSLTGLRGLAAVYVMFYHFFFHMPLASEKLSVFLRHGYLSVDLFFLLSGYVVTTSNARVVETGYRDVRQFGVFIFKRFARLYPLYLCIVLFALYRAIPIAPLPLVAKVALTNLTLTQSWGLSQGIGGPTWSLSLEWAAYFLFPLLTFVFLKSRAWRFGLSIVASCALLLVCAFWPKSFAFRSISGPLDLVQYYSIFPILRCLASFGLGMAIFRLADQGWVKRIFQTPWLDCVLFAMVIVSLFVENSDVIYVLLCFLFILSLVVKQNSAISKLLSLWPIWWLGVISYSIYLLHGFAVNNFVKVTKVFSNIYVDWSYGHTILLLSVAVLITSSVTYLFIEKPSRDYLLGRISRTPKPA